MGSEMCIRDRSASDAGPDIIRSHLFINEITASDAGPDIIRSHLFPYTVSLSQQAKLYVYFSCSKAIDAE